MHIAVAGNIGAGKTSLTKQLSKSLKYKPYYEDVIANPYLDDAELVENKYYQFKGAQ